MSKSFETFISIILTIIFLILFPTYLASYEKRICTENYERYYLNEMAWMIESEHRISVSMWDMYAEYPIRVYNANGARIPEAEESKDGMYIIPKNAKYVQITYGKLSKWVVYDDRTD